MTFLKGIQDYHSSVDGEHHRYRSWEHCYNYFQRSRPSRFTGERDLAALHLAFYLASWGMYRGSSFLLQHAYTVHHDTIDLIADMRFDALWNVDFGANESDGQLLPLALELVENIKNVYKPFARKISPNSAQPTDTLITKIILGTFGCLPACDRYFIDGFKYSKFKFTCVNKQFIHRLLEICRENLIELKKEQAMIEQSSGIRYPLMKLVDMGFWQVGDDLEQGRIQRGS